MEKWRVLPFARLHPWFGGNGFGVLFCSVQDCSPTNPKYASRFLTPFTRVEGSLSHFFYILCYNNYASSRSVKNSKTKINMLVQRLFHRSFRDSLILTGKVPLSTPSTQEKKIFQSVWARKSIMQCMHIIWGKKQSWLMRGLGFDRLCLKK